MIKNSQLVIYSERTVLYGLFKVLPIASHYFSYFSSSTRIRLPEECAIHESNQYLMNMWMNITIQENNCVVSGVVVIPFFFERSAQSYQLCSIENLSNGVVGFEQLIKHDIKLILLNTRHEFLSMSYWSMVRLYSWFPCLLFCRIVIILSKYLFINVWQVAFDICKIVNQCFSALVHIELNFLAFEYSTVL